MRVSARVCVHAYGVMPRSQMFQTPLPESLVGRSVAKQSDGKLPVGLRKGLGQWLT